ncbi:hypothetical protein JW977_02655 [Candidatus Falkowbacteria bacterium]|nr:hypothetical protein [Candidatus Falkowbacteria bacterium]
MTERGGLKQPGSKDVPDFYIGQVVESTENIFICDVTAGNAVVRQYFSAEVMKKHNLKKGNLFLYYPTEDGALNEKCIVPIPDSDFSKYHDLKLTGFDRMRERLTKDFPEIFSKLT